MRSPIEVAEIEKTIPHRHPFLLLDRVIEIGEENIVGIKNLTYNEGFFQGHFPGEPIMPGVMQIEAMAQLAAFKVIRERQAAEGNKNIPSVYFLSIKDAKFRRKVAPGDTLRLEVHAPKGKSSRMLFTGKAYVGEELACEAQMLAMIR